MNETISYCIDAHRGCECPDCWPAQEKQGRLYDSYRIYLDHCKDAEPKSFDEWLEA